MKSVSEGISVSQWWSKEILFGPLSTTLSGHRNNSYANETKGTKHGKQKLLIISYQQKRLPNFESYDVLPLPFSSFL